MNTQKNIRAIVGKNIRYYRKNKKLTIEKLAELSDTDEKYLGGVERAEHNISIDKLEEICSALDIQPYKLFIFGKEDKDNLILILNDLAAEADPLIIKICINLITYIRKIGKNLKN